MKSYIEDAINNKEFNKFLIKKYGKEWVKKKRKLYKQLKSKQLCNNPLVFS